MSTPFAAAPKAVVALPVMGGSPVWGVGKVPTAPIQNPHSGFVGLGITDHFSKNSPAQPIQLTTSTLGIQNGLFTRRMGIRTQLANGEKKMILEDRPANKRQIKAAFHSRGFTVPGKLKSDDAAVLATLRLPEPLAAKPDRLIDVKKEWMRAPEWRQLKQVLAGATKNAQEGFPGSVEHDLKMAENIAQKLTGLSLRPEVTKEIRTEAQIRKAIVQIRSAELEAQEGSEHSTLFRRNPDSHGFVRSDIGTEMAPGHIGDLYGNQQHGNAITDYLMDGDPSPMPPSLGDTMEARSQVGVPPTDPRIAFAAETLSEMGNPLGVIVLSESPQGVITVTPTRNLSPAGDYDLIVQEIRTLDISVRALLGTISNNPSGMDVLVLVSAAIVYGARQPELQRVEDAPELPDTPRVEAAGTGTNTDGGSGGQQSPWWDFLERLLSGFVIPNAEDMARRK